MTRVRKVFQAALGAWTVASLATIPLAAQAGATTLQACTDAASRIVVAQAVERTDDRAKQLTLVRFRVTSVLRGATAPDRLQLEEASGAACGRALFGVVPGVRRILFLDGDGERPQLVRLGARALPGADPVLVDHVAALVRTAHNPAARHHLLIDSVDHERTRIRGDAARALAVHAVLGTRGGRDSTRLSAALDRALDDPDADPTPLWIAARRCDPSAALDRLCAGYLRTDREEILPLLQGALLDVPTDQVADHLLPELTRATPRSRFRAAALMARLSPTPARARLAEALLRSGDRGVAPLATTALLEAGTPPARLEGLTEPEVLRAALLDREGARPAPPARRWRSIDPDLLR